MLRYSVYIKCMHQCRRCLAEVPMLQVLETEFQMFGVHLFFLRDIVMMSELVSHVASLANELP